MPMMTMVRQMRELELERPKGEQQRESRGHLMRASLHNVGMSGISRTGRSAISSWGWRNLAMVRDHRLPTHPALHDSSWEVYHERDYPTFVIWMSA